MKNKRKSTYLQEAIVFVLFFVITRSLWTMIWSEQSFFSFLIHIGIGFASAGFMIWSARKMQENTLTTSYLHDAPLQKNGKQNTSGNITWAALFIFLAFAAVDYVTLIYILKLYGESFVTGMVGWITGIAIIGMVMNDEKQTEAEGEAPEIDPVLEAEHYRQMAE